MFLLNDNNGANALFVIVNLQYKMFLLNNFHNGNDKIYKRFTIQNVSIKFLKKLINKFSLVNLQYKMFLLNLIFPKLLE